MRMIYWSDKLAASAQAHANTCDFRHSRNRVNIGENIWAAPYTNYTDAIARWFNEVHDPMCGCNHAYKHCCGHYIQVSVLLTCQQTTYHCVSKFIAGRYNNDRSSNWFVSIFCRNFCLLFFENVLWTWSTVSFLRFPFSFLTKKKQISRVV